MSCFSRCLCLFLGILLTDVLVQHRHLHRDGPTFAHGSSPLSVGQTKKAEEMGIVPEGTAEKLKAGQIDAVT